MSGSPDWSATTAARARLANSGRCRTRRGRRRRRHWGRRPQLGRGGVLADRQQVLDEHPEQGAPVAHVVPPDVGSQAVQRADEGVADDRRAQVGDVHLLGHVRRGVVDGDRLRPPASARRAARRRTSRRPARRSRRRGDGVDEPRPRDLRARRPPSRFSPRRCASARAASAWKSAYWLVWMTGSASAYSSPKALPRARWNRSVSTPTGLVTTVRLSRALRWLRSERSEREQAMPGPARYRAALAR